MARAGFDAVMATSDTFNLFYSQLSTHMISQISTSILLTYVCMTLPEVAIEIR